MSAHGRYCCKSLKRRSGQFLAKERNERQSPINTASNPLRESPVSLARGDLFPHIIIQSPRLRGGEFESHLQKRLLQQERHLADVGVFANAHFEPILLKKSKIESAAGIGCGRHACNLETR